MTQTRSPGGILLAATLLAAVTTASVPTARAAPEEIQVYLDDLTTPGRFGLDVHNNLAVAGIKAAEYPGARPAEHAYRLTPELYYGLGTGLELGAYALTTRDGQGELHFDGAKLRLKYIATHDEKQGPFWGVNFEVGKSDLAVAEHAWNYELKGIYGRRIGAWVLACNVNLDAALSTHGGPATLGLSTKVARKAGRQTQLGLESYNELGPLRSAGSLGDQSQMLYAVVDNEFDNHELSIGIGRGLSHGSDPWVLKAVIGFHF